MSTGRSASEGATYDNQLEAGEVGTVQVVDGEQHRSMWRRVAKDRRHRLVQAEAQGRGVVADDRDGLPDPFRDGG